MPELTLVPVEPIGERPVTALLHGSRGCRAGTINLKVYPPEDVANGAAFAALRQADPWLSTRDVARVTGLSPFEVNGLEHGKFRFADDGSRALYVAAVAEASLQRREALHDG